MTSERLLCAKPPLDPEPSTWFLIEVTCCKTFLSQHIVWQEKWWQILSISQTDPAASLVDQKLHNRIQKSNVFIRRHTGGLPYSPYDQRLSTCSKMGSLLIELSMGVCLLTVWWHPKNSLGEKEKEKERERERERGEKSADESLDIWRHNGQPDAYGSWWKSNPH